VDTCTQARYDWLKTLTSIPESSGSRSMGKIHDVVVKKLVTHSDDRGYFREVLRDDDHLLRNFGQTSVTKTYPGVIKAFHWHEDQDDIWYVADGMARVVLYDRRPESPTYKQTQVIYAGEDNPVSILIPTRLAHGYQVLGNKPVILFYHVTKSYNPSAPDEHRIPFDDPEIGFNWSIVNR
jgi:dTDP-4-dehydrorhamnose 3,5-epimerase